MGKEKELCVRCVFIKSSDTILRPRSYSQGKEQEEKEREHIKGKLVLGGNRRLVFKELIMRPDMRVGLTGRNGKGKKYSSKLLWTNPQIIWIFLRLSFWRRLWRNVHMLFYWPVTTGIF